MRILVYGLSKSGTSILGAMLKSSLEQHLGRKVQDVFEPKEIVQESGRLHYIGRRGACMAESAEDEVVKTLFDSGISPEQMLEHQGHFDKKIFIARDPRDRFLSHLFYRWQAAHKPDPQHFARALRLAEHKEKYPRDLPVLFLQSQNPANFPQISRRMSNAYGKVIDFLESAGDDWCVIKYEDLMDGRVGKLEEFLGFPVATGVSVTGERARVVRTKSYGNWRTWFLAEDVNFFRPAFKRYMQYLDYDYSDWELEECDTLPSEQGSQYMLRMFTAGREPENTSSAPAAVSQKAKALAGKMRRFLRG